MWLRASVLFVLTATVTAGAQMPEARPLPKGTNVLVGRIVEIGSDAPVSGAVVTLIGYFDAAGAPAPTLAQDMYSTLASEPRSVMTTADGTFVFRDLAAGRYSLAAAAFGYANNTYPPHLLEVRDSRKATDVRLHVWKLGAISGIVVDEHGEPVTGVPVSALRRIEQDGGLTLRDQADAETDDRGAYRIAQLPPGNYVVGVVSTAISVPAAVAADIDGAAMPGTGPAFMNLIRSGVELKSGDGMRIGEVVLQRPGPASPIGPDGRTLGYSTTLSPGTTSVDEAAVISLGSGESREGVDVSMRFAPTVRVSGIAVGPNGPVRNLTLRLAPPYGLSTDFFSFNPTGRITTVTDASGGFTFPAIVPGQYVLKTQAWAEATATSPGVSLWATQSIVVGDKDITGLTVAVRPGIRVSGRVEFKDATGPVITANQSVGFVLMPVGAENWRTSAVRLRSGDPFTTAGDPPGLYIVLPFGETPGWTLQRVSRASQPLPDDTIELEDSDVSDVVITFTRKATRISGSVADSSDVPDTDADVIVFPADTKLWRAGVFNNRRVRAMHATSAAAYEFTALPPGDYYIAAVGARGPEDWRDPRFLDRLVGAATKVTLNEGDEKTLALRTTTPGGR